MKKILIAATLMVGALSAWPVRAAGPVFDNSATSNLTGTYYFRQVVYVIGDNAGDLSDAVSFYGNIVFDGAGNYSIPSGTPLLQYTAGSVQNLSSPVTGTYSMSSTGYGSLSSPLNSLYGVTDTIYFMFTNGVLMGSTTEGNYNDVFIGAQVPSPAPTVSTFSGSWSMAGFFPGLSPSGAADAFFQLNPNGSGTIGSVTVPGYVGQNGTAVQTQNSSGVTYFFSNGAAVITFPTSSNALYFGGKEYLYFSPDGNFVFGGNPLGFDMLVGVRNGAAGATQNFSGLYYQAGVDQDLSQYSATGFANFDTFYGSFNAGGGTIVAHERVQSVFNNNALGTTFADTYAVPTTSPYNNTASYTQYAYGSNGLYRIGAGVWPFLGLNLAIQAPTFSGPGVFLNPAGVINSASSAPFTAGISNGELITLYGTNLANTTLVSPVVPLPTNLGGVSVSVNGVYAPIYYVSPTQVAVVVPYGNPFPVAQIQLTNGVINSNIVTQYVYTTTPGVFTVPAGGIGYAAAVHANGQLVTTTNPAAPGETIETFLTGLGAVFPGIQDGAAGPTSTLSTTTNTITADISGVAADNGPYFYSGLAPALAALYQVNVNIPTTATAGDNILDIGGPDSYTGQALIPVGTATANASIRESARPQTSRSTRVIDAKKIVDAGPKLKRPVPAFQLIAK